MQGETIFGSANPDSSAGSRCCSGLIPFWNPFRRAPSKPFADRDGIARDAPGCTMGQSAIRPPGRQMSKSRIVWSLWFAVSLQLPGATFDVKTFGAKADGKSGDREAINKAIDAASAAGGGTVYFPAGTYTTGSIRLRSNI